MELILSLSTCTKINSGPGLLPQLNVSSQDVGMEVRQEDILNLPVIRFGVVEILLNIPLRIDDRGHTGPLSRDQVGRVGQATEVILTKDQSRNNFPISVALFDPKPQAMVF